MMKWAGQIRKGDVITVDGVDYKVARVESVMGGSWFNLHIVGHESEPVAFGHRERIEVRS